VPSVLGPDHHNAADGERERNVNPSARLTDVPRLDFEVMHWMVIPAVAAAKEEGVATGNPAADKGSVISEAGVLAWEASEDQDWAAGLDRARVSVPARGSAAMEPRVEEIWQAEPESNCLHGYHRQGKERGPGEIADYAVRRQGDCAPETCEPLHRFGAEDSDFVDTGIVGSFLRFNACWTARTSFPRSPHERLRSM